MRDRIIERHKEGQGYQKISKEINLALSTVGKYGDGTANLPRNGRPRKINERTSRWISRNVQINPFTSRSEIKTDLEGAGINISKDTINRILYRKGFRSRSPRKVPLLKTKHVKDRLKFVKTYETSEKKGMQFWEKVIWSDGTKLDYSEETQWQVFGKKMALPSRSTIPSPQLSLRGGSIMIWGCFSS